MAPPRLEIPPQPTWTAPAPAPAVVSDGYWIISARHCDSHLGTSQSGHFKVWSFDAAGNGVPATLDQFYASLSPGVPLCLMMHGSFVEWESMCNDSFQTNRWLRRPAPQSPLHVVFFTWPSDDTPKVWLPIDVAILGRRAGRYGFYVAEIISRVPNEHPICLLGHSHGARMAASTLHVLGGGSVDGTVFRAGPYRQHRIRAVFAAAAFDHHWLNPGELYGQAVQRPEVVLNLINRRDAALGFYPLHRPLTTLAAAARAGFTSGDRFLIGTDSQKLIDVDVTDQIGAGHVWPHYYANAQLAQVIAPFVYFQDPVPVVSLTHKTRTARPLRQALESHRVTKWQTSVAQDR